MYQGQAVLMPVQAAPATPEPAPYVPPQHQPLSSAVVSEHERETRPVDRIDHETDKGATLLVGQVNPKEVLEVTGATGIELVVSIAHRQPRFLDRG
jgi:hypothetical protein